MGYAGTFEVETRAPIERVEAASQENKLLGLELVRFTCAFAVLLWHYRHFYEVTGSPVFDQWAQPLHKLFAPLFDYGLFGVQMFWGISGFIFFWKYGAAIAERTVGAAKFFWLRFSRLYPLHLVTLLLVAALQPQHLALTGTPFIYQDNSAVHFAQQLFMATHWGGAEPYTFNGPIWSVSAEVAVYALFFLAVRQFGANWRTIGVAIAASLFAGTLGFASPVLFCACYFFAGGAAARMYLDAATAGRSRWLAIGALIVLAAIVGTVTLSGMKLDQPTITFLLLFMMPPVLVLAAQDWKLLHRWPKAIQAAGNLTYSTYLVHFPLQLAVAIACAATGFVLPLESPLMLVAYLAGTIVIGRWVYLRFELPAQRWIRRRALKRS